MSKPTKTLLLAIFAAVFTSLTFTATTMADPKGGKGGGFFKEEHGKEHKEFKNYGNRDHGSNKNFRGEEKESPSNIFISDDDRRAINDYFHRNSYNYSALPPGIAMNLARGKPLPPGIAKRYLPDDLVESLHLNPDYDYYLVGNDLATVARATGIVLDIFNIGR